ncbi:MAG: isochorismatase family protein [Planctomycetota bacterium]
MSVGRLDPERSAVLLVDLQEKLLPVMHEKTTVERRAGRLIQGANILKVPVILTEQYPKGLGRTVGSIARQLDAAVCTDEKTRFSACSDSVIRLLEKFEVSSVVVAGLETHICVLQTCLDLVDRGYTVGLCEDAVSSRRPVDKKAAVGRMVQAGVLPTTVEAVLYELLGDASSMSFRELRKIITSKDG